MAWALEFFQVPKVIPIQSGLRTIILEDAIYIHLCDKQGENVLPEDR